MSANNIAAPDEQTKPESRRGGFLPTLISFGVGVVLGAVAALVPAQWVASLLFMNTEEAAVLDTLDARIALIVVVAAFAAFVGVAFDVLHAPESAGVDLFVRCCALVAGSTALIGALIAIPRALQGSFNFAATGILIVILVGLLIVGGIRNARRAHGLDRSAEH